MAAPPPRVPAPKIDRPIGPLAIAAAPTATDQVFKSLYDAIVSLALPPGSKVSEAEIAKQLGVSRQPVRDAFFRLSQLGFLSIRPQRATLITKIADRAVLDAAFIRTAIEVECLRVAAQIASGSDLARLQDELARQEAALDDADPACFHSLDETFHETLCSIAGQPQAWALIQDQKAHMDRVRYLTLSRDRRRTVLAEHRSIVAAIRGGDPAGAEQAMRRHLGDLGNALARIRSAHPQYFEEAG